MMTTRKTAGEVLRGVGTTVFRGFLDAVLSAFGEKTGIVVIYEAVSNNVAAEEFRGGGYDFFAGTADTVACLTQQGQLQNNIKIATARLALCVRSGVEKPDLSDVSKLLQTLTGASRIVFGGPTVQMALGQFTVRQILLAGISQKMLFLSSGAAVCEAVADGNASLGMTFGNEIIIAKKKGQGVVLMPLPEELNIPMEYRAGVATESFNQEGAQKFLAFLTDPRFKPLFDDAGFK